MCAKQNDDKKYDEAVNRDCRNIMRKEGWDICISSSIEYDKSLIFLSTATLGFIFGVTKIVGVHGACTPFLIFILVLLLLSILSSLLSFWFDQLHGEALMICRLVLHRRQ